MFKKIFNLFKKDKTVKSKRELIIDFLGFDPVEMGLISEEFFNFNQTKLSEFFINGDKNGS
jgi:hypothetical protein